MKIGYGIWFIALAGMAAYATPARAAGTGTGSPFAPTEVEMETLILRYEAKAAAAGLPPNTFRERAREGAAKGASLSEIEAVLRTRLEQVRTAARIMESADPQRRNQEVARACIALMASALDSGVPSGVFEGMFDLSRRAPSPRLQAIIEAAEYLHLSGVPVDHVRAFVRDVSERDLRRMEVLRAARLWIPLARDGLSEDDIRARIWRPVEDVRRRGDARGRANGDQGGRRPGPGHGRRGPRP